MRAIVDAGPDLNFQQKLLQWYDRHQRALPWRATGGARPDPYRVWLSEIMLQQTTVATVKSYFLKFINLWPNVEAMAAADLDDILAAWAGLGYYARARNLHACAKIITQNYGGVFPAGQKALMALPGIGPYTSGAIAAIAFDQPVAAVDGNVERVLSRFYAIKTPLPDSKPLIKQKAASLVPENRPGDFAQGLMDLGATICTPRSPDCRLCPLATDCRGLKQNIAPALPIRAAKKVRPTRFGKAFVVQRQDGAVLLRRRPEKGLLGGMLEVPCSEWVEGKSRATNIIEHTFTHFHLMLEVVVSDDFDGAVRRDTESHQWVPVKQLKEKALPTIMKKVLVQVFGPDVFKA